MSKPKNPLNTITLVCVRCGVTFHRYKSQPSRYCTKECLENKWAEDKRRGKPPSQRLCLTADELKAKLSNAVLAKRPVKTLKDFSAEEKQKLLAQYGQADPRVILRKRAA